MDSHNEHFMLTRQFKNAKFGISQLVGKPTEDGKSITEAWKRINIQVDMYVVPNPDTPTSLLDQRPENWYELIAEALGTHVAEEFYKTIKQYEANYEEGMRTADKIDRGNGMTEYVFKKPAKPYEFVKGKFKEIP